MAIREMQVPLADVMIETGFGIVAMNAALASNGVGATHATVAIRFMAGLSQGHDYSRTNHSGGAVFSFWLIGGGAAASYSRTDLHVYNRYSENIRIDISITFEPLPEVA